MVVVTQTRVTPGDDELLKVDVDSKPLPEERRQVFVSTVMKALYPAKHVRADILNDSSFLARRMTKATEEDWSKLTHMIEYASGTKDHGLLLRPGKGLALTVYCDAAFGNWGADEHSTSGCVIYVGDSGRGEHNEGCPVFVKCKRQTCRSRSSAEAELVCVSDCGPQVLWTRQFMMAQDIQEIEENATLIFEDNEACIDLLQNGRPQGEMTRHLRL